MAHKTGQGSTRNGRDSAGRRLGIKRFSGTFVTAGSILVRQRGTKIHPGGKITAWQWMRSGVPVMLVSLAIASVVFILLFSWLSSQAPVR